MPPRSGGMMVHRLLYLIGQLGGGGSERQLLYLLTLMDRATNMPTVVVWNYDPAAINHRSIVDLAVPVISAGESKSRVGKLLQFRELVGRLKPQVIHSYSFFTNFAAEFGAWGRPIRRLGSLRGDFFRERASSGLLLSRLSGRWPRNQIFNNFAAAKNASYHGGPFVPGRVFVVRNCVNSEAFAPVRLPVNDPPIVLGVGSLVRTKRWDRLVQATADLAGQRIGVRVRIAGDGPCKASLLQQAHDLGVGHQLELTGYDTDIANAIASANLVVHVADQEGSPNVVMEAMACGRPVVATDAGDVADLINDGVHGFIVPRDDRLLLSRRIAELVTDRRLAEQFGAAAREKATRLFGCQQLVTETLRAYRTVGWSG